MLALAEYLRFYDDAIRALADRGYIVTVVADRDCKRIGETKRDTFKRIRTLSSIAPRGSSR